MLTGRGHRQQASNPGYRLGDDLAADPTFGVFTLAPLEILGVDAFRDSAVVVKIRVKTLPLKQWQIGRELRRRIKKAFDAQGIEIPIRTCRCTSARRANRFWSDPPVRSRRRDSLRDEL